MEQEYLLPSSSILPSNSSVSNPSPSYPSSPPLSYPHPASSQISVHAPSLAYSSPPNQSYSSPPACNHPPSIYSPTPSPLSTSCPPPPPPPPPTSPSIPPPSSNSCPPPLPLPPPPPPPPILPLPAISSQQFSAPSPNFCSNSQNIHPPENLPLSSSIPPNQTSHSTQILSNPPSQNSNLPPSTIYAPPPLSHPPPPSSSHPTPPKTLPPSYTPPLPSPSTHPLPPQSTLSSIPPPSPTSHPSPLSTTLTPSPSSFNPPPSPSSNPPPSSLPHPPPPSSLPPPSSPSSLPSPFCPICHRQFSFRTLPYSFPSCPHSFCLDCLRLRFKENTFMCPLDQKTCSEALSSLTLSRLYTDFLLEWKRPRKGFKLFCSEHPEKKIKFICKGHQSFLCSLCIYKHYDHHLKTDIYPSSSVLLLLDLLLQKLSLFTEKSEKIRESLVSLKSSDRVLSNDILPILKQATEFLKNPFLSKISDNPDLQEAFPFTFLPDKPAIKKREPLPPPVLDSKIIAFSSNRENNRDFIFELFAPKKLISASLLYRGSENNFSAKIFHQKCDNRGSSLVIVKGENGRIFGGYNSAGWVPEANGKKYYYYTAPGSFLFSLQHREKMGLKREDNKKAIHYDLSDGPTFGYGYDLCIKDACHENNGSYANLSKSYYKKGRPVLIPDSEEAKAYLAGVYEFRVGEYEVFAVTVEDCE